MRKSLLKQRIDEVQMCGWNVLSFVDGRLSPSNKNSNLCKALDEARKDNPGKQIDFIVGSRTRYGGGNHMAIIIR